MDEDFTRELQIRRLYIDAEKKSRYEEIKYDTAEEYLSRIEYGGQIIDLLIFDRPCETYADDVYNYVFRLENQDEHAIVISEVIVEK